MYLKKWAKKLTDTLWETFCICRSSNRRYCAFWGLMSSFPQIMFRYPDPPLILFDFFSAFSNSVQLLCKLHRWLLQLLFFVIIEIVFLVCIITLSAIILILKLVFGEGFVSRGSSLYFWFGQIWPAKKGSSRHRWVVFYRVAAANSRQWILLVFAWRRFPAVKLGFGVFLVGQVSICEAVVTIIITHVMYWRPPLLFEFLYLIGLLNNLDIQISL